MVGTTVTDETQMQTQATVRAAPARGGRGAARRRRGLRHSPESDLRAAPRLLLRQVAGALRQRHRDQEEPRHGGDRAVGVRQVDPHPHLQPHLQPLPRPARHGPDPDGRRGPPVAADGPARSAAPHRHDLPEAEPVPDDRVRQRRVRTASALPAEPLGALGPGRGGAEALGDLGRGQAQAERAWATRSAAGSSSACASREPSPPSPRCCSWTSPARPSIRSGRPRSRS